MSFLLLNESSLASYPTPASGKGRTMICSTTSMQFFQNDAGRWFGQTNNASIATNGNAFASDTWLTDSDLQIPSFGLQVRTVFRWQISASKTGAGTAQPTYIIRIGTGKAVTDTAILTLTGPLQTAVADIGTLNILATVRSIGSGTSAVIQGTAWWDHRGTAANTTTSGTGFANDSTGHVEGTSAGFNSSSLAGNYVSLSLNGGASAVWTITQVVAEANW